MPGSNSRPNVSEGYEVPLSYRALIVLLVLLLVTVFNNKGREDRENTKGRKAESCLKAVVWAGK